MDEISLFEYVNILSRRKGTVIVVTVLVLIAVGAVLAFLPRTYEGKVTLIFPESGEGGFGTQLAHLTGLSIPGGGSAGLSGRNIYTTVLQSRTISQKVCQRLDLGRYGVDYRKLTKQVSLETPKDGSLNLRCQVPTSWTKGVVPRDETRQRTASLAAEIANAYIAELIVYDRTNALFMGKKNRLFIEDQLGRTKQDLALAETKLRFFQEQNPTLMPPAEASAYTNQALGIVTKQVEVDVALQEIDGQIGRARTTWDAGAPQDISPEAIIDSPVISALRSDLAKLQVRYSSLLEDFTENHPDVVALRQQIEKTQDELQAEVSRIVSGKAGSANPAHQELLKQLVILEVDRGGLSARKSALDDAYSALESHLSGLPVKQVEYTRLLRDLKATETVYNTLLAEHAKARVAEGREKDAFLVLDEAIPPNKPIKPRVMLTLIAALMIGLLGGVLIAIVLEGAAAARRWPADSAVQSEA